MLVFLHCTAVPAAAHGFHPSFLPVPVPESRFSGLSPPPACMPVPFRRRRQSVIESVPPARGPVNNEQKVTAAFTHMATWVEPPLARTRYFATSISSRTTQQLLSRISEASQS